jgi:hypothetical protein
MRIWSDGGSLDQKPRKHEILDSSNNQQLSLMPLLAFLPRHELVSLAVPTCININSWETVFSSILFSMLLRSIYDMI